ncbi:phage shock protein C (PspC) family protein [Dietzia kunjamensis subsp. schimae]|uniref:Phage shock protein C (PspC) family protein n=2 Tax=Dietzia kunjamensis TaxID=322509 RepID=A0ABY1N274_9ACTN|nr:phage shock protein C (PspC) family protein [Dietzia kunjamensis subsp. schimae]
MASMSENATDPAPATAVRSVSPVAGPQARSAAVATTDFRWYPRLTRGSDGSVVAGVCVGLADHLGVRVVHVRLVMVLLATLSGAGVALYSALWALTPTGPASAGAGRGDERERRRGMALAVVAVAGAVLSFMVTTATGLSVIVPVLVVALGAGLVWQQYDGGGRVAPRSVFDWARVTAGATLVVVGLAVVVLGQVEFAALRSSLLAVVATLVGVGLLSVPVGLRLWRSLEEERAARIRESERSDIASHLHDSVLQTLALIQKRSDDPGQVARLARRQERELRQWLFGAGSRMSSGAATFAGAVEVMVGDVEDVYGLRVDQVVVGGDGPVGDAGEAVLGAVREALVNVAKHAGVDTADVFVENDGRTLSAFVRDRGRGFDPDAVGGDRHGLAQSIRHRVESRGGTVRVRSTLGRGTEIGIEMPLEDE